MDTDITLTDEVSPDDIALAQTHRRKSCRRSLVLFPSCDSPVNYSSPKVRMHRRSLGRSLHAAFASPVSSKHKRGHSISFLRNKPKSEIILAHEKSLQQLQESHPATPIKLQEKIKDSPKLVSLPSEYHNSSTIINKVIPPSDTNVSALPSEHIPPSQSSPVYRSADSPFIDFADALYESYLQELVAWPTFLGKMEANTRAVRPLMSIPSHDQMADNPVLAPFAEILSNKDAFNAKSTAQRLRRAHCLAMCSLSRVANIRKRITLSIPRLANQLEIVRRAKLSHLLPFVCDSPNPTVGQLFNMANSSLIESD